MKKNYRIYDAKNNYVNDVIETTKTRAIEKARSTVASNPFAAPAVERLTAKIDGIAEKVESTGKW